MQVSVSNTQGLERRLEIAVPAARVSAEVEQRLKKISRTVRMKGFRPGKVPMQVVKQQYGGQVRAETLSDLMRSTFAEAVAQEKLRPAGGPRIEPLAMDPDSDLRYAAVFEVLPDIELKPIENMELVRPTVEVTETDIDAMLESMRRQQADYVAVERESRSGDRVIVDFKGRIDGVPFQGGQGKGTPFVLGAGRALPDFEKGLVGLAAGATRTVPVQFPADYGAREVAGKLAEFTIAMQRVEEQVVPPVDDSLAQAFGVHEGGVPKLREEVKATMEREAGDAIRGRMRTQVLEALFRDNPLELPRALVEEQVQELQIDAMRRAGIDLSKADARQAPPRGPLEDPARRRVALGLIMGELLRRAGLQVERARVDARLDQLAAAYPNPEEVRRAYLQNPEALRQVEASVLEDQAVDWIAERAKVTERQTSFAELTGFGRAGLPGETSVG